MNNISFEKCQKMIDFGRSLNGDKLAIHLFIKSILLSLKSEDIIYTTQYDENQYSQQENNYDASYVFISDKQYKQYNALIKYFPETLTINTKLKNYFFLSRPWSQERLRNVFNGISKQKGKQAREIWIFIITLEYFNYIWWISFKYYSYFIS